MRRPVAVVLGFLGTLSFFSCADFVAPTNSAASKSTLGRLRPVGEMQALQPFEADLDAVPTVITIGEIPFIEGVLADISITGLIHLTSDEAAWPINYTGYLDQAGIGVPYGSCLVDAKIYFSKIVSGPLGGGSCLIPRVMADYSTRAIIGGIITARRGPYPDTYNYCEGKCVYVATGGQHISIRPLAGDLTFKGTWSSQSGKTLFLPLSASNPYILTRFQEFTSPSGLTLKPLVRSWKKADSTLLGNRTNINECPNGNWQGNPATYPPILCDIYVKESGIMGTLTRVNGVQHTDSVTVYCLDSVPLFNNHKIRQGLLAALDSSHVNQPLEQVERLFFIVQDSVTPGAEPYVYIFPQLPGADACRAAGWNDPPDFSNRPANTKLLAWGHTHPAIGTVTFCLDRNGQVQKDPEGNDALQFHFPGVSEGDKTQFQIRNDPSYVDYAGPVFDIIIDPQQLWIMKPTQLPNSANNLSANHPTWKLGQCAWPKRKI